MKILPLILTVLIGPLLSYARPVHADAITKNVPADYSSIQAAISAAVNDPLNTYTIIVEPGTYPGGIQITAHPNVLTIKGRETARTIVSGSPSGPLLTITNNSSGNIIVQNLFFRSASDGVQISNNTTSITIANSIFSGLSNKGVIASGSNSIEIKSNTFHRNTIAVDRDVDTIVIRNNIFSENSTAIDPTPFSDNGIYFNLFNPAPAAGDLTGTNFQPDNSTVTNSDPNFVAAADGDFHVMTAPSGTSPVIDRGDTNVGNDSVDGTTPDIGAYGGSFSDTIPYPVSGLSSSATGTAPYDISLSWQANTAYTIAGYRLYYGNASGTYTGTDAAEGPSPVNLTTASAVLSNLSPTTTSPPTPVLSVPAPRNESLDIRWSAIPGATGYKVHYGTLLTSENTINVGNVTSYTIGGLTNGQTYVIAVSAFSQAVYYIAVTAYDSGGQTLSPGIAHESDYSPETTVALGPVLESGLSNEVLGLPERLFAYPDLPNTGCFIATAAYGSYDAAPVRILRDFRDRLLLPNAPGRALVRWYYRTSPSAARYLEDHPLLKPLVRVTLEPVIAVAVVLTYAPWVLASGAAVLLIDIRRRMRRRRTA